MKKIIFKKTNILLFLLILMLVLFLAVLFRMRVSSVKQSDKQNLQTQNKTISKEDYEKNIFGILDEYEGIIEKAGIYATSTHNAYASTDPIFLEIDNLKNKVIDIKAPSVEYKDLHMSLMMSLLSIKDYLEVPVSKKNIVCINYIEKVKKNRALLLD